MRAQRIAASAIIMAPARQVYAILADYCEGHPRILPRQYFPLLEVEQGGTGAGTRIRFQMHATGSTRTFLATVTEPEPGHVLMETNELVEPVPAKASSQSRSVTTFTVDPVDEDQHAQVTIATELVVANWLEGLFTTMFLRRVYTQELKQLAALVEGRSISSNANAGNTTA